MPRTTTSGDDVTSVPCDALVVGAFKGPDGARLHDSVRPVDGAFDGVLEETLRAMGFKGDPGQVATVPSFGRIPARVVAVVGLGDESSIGIAPVRKGAAVAARKLSEHSDVAIALHQAVDGSAAAAAEGFLLGTYTFTTYKTDPKPSKIQTITLLGASNAEIERGTILAEATVLARDLVNDPPGRLTPAAMARKAQEVADVGGLECTVIDAEELAGGGYGGILGVGMGSEIPPLLIRLRYAPEHPATKLTIVGKGVTFDSGGLSLKDGKNMEQMKTDMAGAAAVLAAMSALPRLTPAVEVTAYLPAVENLPSGRSLKPGDVITHYGGRTTEVLNTDAEGRLILADALARASEEKPDAIVDVATLTGSMMVALGSKWYGTFSTDDALMEELRVASEAAGEPMWPMPLVDEYSKELESEIADAKNIGSRWGGSIIAALFLKEFVGKGIPWAHLDIAGPARAESDYDEVSRGGTGVPTRTLVHWIEGRAR